MYIHSFTQFESIFKGIFIPKKYYTPIEYNRGKRPIVEVTNAQIEILKTDKIFNYMVAKGELLILDTMPIQFIDAKIKNGILETENAKLKAELSKIKLEQVARTAVKK